MAENNKSSKKINDMLNNIDTMMDSLFSKTYHSSNQNNIMFDKVSDNLDDTIKDIIEGDPTLSDMSSTTKLYQKLLGDKNDTNNPLLNMGDKNKFDPMDIFNNQTLMQNIMSTYADTRWVKQLDDEIDMIIKYMPKLAKALNIKRDNVLCADSFSKSFLKYVQTDKIGDELEEKFSTNVAAMEKLYNIAEKVNRWYDLASKYGETFVYIVPYNKALKMLMDRRDGTSSGSLYSMREIGVITEHGLNSKHKPIVKGTVHNEASGISINLRIDDSKILSHVIDELYTIQQRIQNEDIFKSVQESFIEEIILETDNKSTTSFKDHIDKKNDTFKFNQTIGDELKFEDDNKTSSDGFLDTTKRNNTNRLKVNGAVIRTLERERTIPIYIEDICLGYFYIRINPVSGGQNDGNRNLGNTVPNPLNTMSNQVNQSLDGDSGDLLLKQISGEISRAIDVNFINANVDLKKDIYMMLKYNDIYNRVDSTNMNVTFIPAEDVIHWHYNFDHDTHRGRSDLWNSLIPAKMRIMLTTMTTLGQVIRGSDRRVYYVKNIVDTNVSKTLLNVVNQIKKGNFGIRQVESINNILGLLGRFNDFVIPIGPSGDSPITFDIMPGQQFELPQDLANDLEEAAISPIVPLEMVNSSANMDFAIRYTMTHSLMLREALERQAITEGYLTRITNKIYMYEFNDNIKFDVELPPPVFLVLTQSTQLLQNAAGFIENLVNTEMAGESDEAKALFTQRYLHYLLSSYLDLKRIKSIKDQIKIDLSIDKNKKQEE